MAEPGREPQTLPAVRTTLAPPEIVSRLDALARRGKLPGFEPGSNGDLFCVLAFGQPFDHELVGRAQGGKVGFALRMKPRLPLIFGAIVIVTIWPGVWLTASMLTTYFPSWYRLGTWGTAAWYLPLTVLPLPWMWKKQVAGSRAAARADAEETIRRIAGAIGGEVEGAEGAKDASHVGPVEPG